VPTLEEVAKLAGVSRATASRFHSEPEGQVRGQACGERAAQKLSYVPNRGRAHSRHRPGTDSIGLVIPDRRGSCSATRSFLAWCEGSAKSFHISQLQLVLLAPQSAADESRRKATCPQDTWTAS